MLLHWEFRRKKQQHKKEMWPWVTVKTAEYLIVVSNLAVSDDSQAAWVGGWALPSLTCWKVTMWSAAASTSLLPASRSGSTVSLFRACLRTLVMMDFSIQWSASLLESGEHWWYVYICGVCWTALNVSWFKKQHLIIFVYYRYFQEVCSAVPLLLLCVLIIFLF